VAIPISLRKDVKILVIDDEKGLRDMLRQELGAEGYSVTSVESGTEALDLLKQSRFDLVISDIKMANMDGLQVLEAIKQVDPGIEVIMVTGYGTIESAVAAMKKGAYDFVQKPFTLDEMLNLVEKALEKAELKALVSLYETSKAIFSALKAHDLLPMLVENARRFLKADDVAIMLRDDRGKLRLRASIGLEGSKAESARLELAEKAVAKAEETGERTLAGLELDETIQPLIAEERIHPPILSPLPSKSGILGILCAARKAGSDPFTGTEQWHACVFASQVSQAIDNARLYEELERKLEDLKEAYAKLSITQNELIRSEKLAGIGRLASEVAHELNNPLTVIIGLIELLLNPAYRSEDHPGDLNTIREQSLRCRRIVENLLEFAHSRPGEKTPVQPNVILDKTLELVEYDLKASGVRVVKDYDSGLPLVRADPVQLQQVFLNLINNVRDALDGIAEPSLILRTRSQEGAVRILFADNGRGIPKQLLGRIFDPFFTTKEVGQGPGLGLSVSYGIVRDHGGEIRVENGSEKGSIFCVQLPALSA